MRATLIALALAGFTSAASADPGAHADARELSASPEVPSLGMAWRDYLRGRLGATIPLSGERNEHGFRFGIAGMVELHNDTDDVFPNNNWRGRLVVRVVYVITCLLSGVLVPDASEGMSTGGEESTGAGR